MLQRAVFSSKSGEKCLKSKFKSSQLFIFLVITKNIAILNFQSHKVFFFVLAEAIFGQQSFFSNQGILTLLDATQDDDVMDVGDAHIVAREIGSGDRVWQTCAIDLLPRFQIIGFLIEEKHHFRIVRIRHPKLVQSRRQLRHFDFVISYNNY